MLTYADVCGAELAILDAALQELEEEGMDEAGRVDMALDQVLADVCGRMRTYANVQVYVVCGYGAGSGAC